MDTNSNSLKKKLLITITVFLAVVGILYFAFFWEGAGQNIEAQEPMFNFAAPGSKIAGIQTLVTKGGLSKEQYQKVYKVLNEQLPALEPDAQYFVYVDDSLDSAKTKSNNPGDNVEIGPIPADGESGEVEAFSTTAEPRVEMELVDTVLFTMLSESGKEYAVTVYTGGDISTAEVKIEQK